jgi:hypothetical protein
MAGLALQVAFWYLLFLSLVAAWAAGLELTDFRYMRF